MIDSLKKIYAYYVHINSGKLHDIVVITVMELQVIKLLLANFNTKIHYLWNIYASMFKCKRDWGWKRLTSIHQHGPGGIGSYGLALWLLRGWGRAGGAGGQDGISDGKAGTAGISSSMGRGREGTSWGLFGRQLEVPTPLRSMVTGIAPFFSSRLVE